MNDPAVVGLVAFTVILLGFFATSAFIVWVLIQFALKMMSPRPKEKHEPPYS